MERLKIGITCYPTLGGSGVVATELGKLLAEKGHQVHFITHSMPFRLGKFHKNIFYHEVEVNDYYVFKYPPYDLSLASKLAQVAKQEELDLLHVHYAIPHAVCALLAKQMVGSHLKVVTTLHGTDITVLAEDESLSDLIRYAINQSDAVTAVSQDLIRETRQLLGIEKPIDLAYNFVDKRVYYPREVTALRKEFAHPDEKILIHISNFRPVKRVMDVVDIFERVHRDIPARLLFVGEGPELSKVLCKVKEFGLQERVTFCGKQDDVAQLLSLADLMLLPSEKESFGLVALEAMACGVPTIASNAGGIPELITHEETGYLADIGDVEQMASYARMLLTNNEMYQRMREACLYRARYTFCNDLITRQYEELYYRVLERPVPEALSAKPLQC
ncbi:MULTISPECIES: N-acetyl-alpha-D-glucosaminyl L-malate synthase BshA [Paenibacillus]|uniref:N-acetyl-alpha-D-glucosaminyl L-malate synthase n=1 Tax=Paenibacillus naphthalenovorans TaxID=162209 RepID=A0A0U2UL18_9BACL|nr:MULTISPECIES: N-acetyl-alpha-D-glucosaminyl L-malate synthase BshA [Paenibacillus]ALS22641.1 N-acetyl-alpha-D-glucosaminyl L-malate synthase [Paenibacillus naphthalenovorans]NTZ17747.1 N-acetyl-alpha-D-glucosaminyl L-malate synthase BshA [Paenibacillus sp. JMULE4]GCL70438.1 N-acetyl-alpha-D-glucosaminyl L-malate synthase BshA [Paenibacillus naphthalenovorans]SDH82329.1 N-acetyl-alpha-D-glucosaminyl L-malate synthase BshA [Paenibacillus naphthalenovorans]